MAANFPSVVIITQIRDQFEWLQASLEGTADVVMSQQSDLNDVLQLINMATASIVFVPVRRDAASGIERWAMFARRSNCAGNDPQVLGGLNQRVSRVRPTGTLGRHDRPPSVVKLRVMALPPPRKRTSPRACCRIRRSTAASGKPILTCIRKRSSWASGSG